MKPKKYWFFATGGLTKWYHFFRRFLGRKLRGTNDFIDGTTEYKKGLNFLRKKIESVIFVAFISSFLP